MPGVKAEVFVPEVANHVPHVRVSWDAGGEALTPAAVVKALKDGEPSIGIRSEGPALVIGVWMMQPGEEKIVARRLRQVLEHQRRPRRRVDGDRAAVRRPAASGAARPRPRCRLGPEHPSSAAQDAARVRFPADVAAAKRHPHRQPRPDRACGTA